MKFISFNHDNSEKFGIIENNLITDLTGKIEGALSLKAVSYTHLTLPTSDLV